MAEAKALNFVNKVLKTNFSNFHADLKTGVVLCELMNEVSFKMTGTRPITQIAKMNIAFQHYENISKALKTMRTLGVQDRDIFSTINLYDADNIPQVAHCLCIVEKLYDGSPTSTAPSAPVRVAPTPAPARSAPAPPPSKPTPQAVVAPKPPVSVAPSTPTAAPVSQATPRSATDDKKISDALLQLDSQRQRWEAERSKFELKIAEQDAALTKVKQSESEKQALLDSKIQIERKLQEQYNAKLNEMEEDMTNKVAQKLLEVEKERQSRNNEIQSQQIQASKQIEQLTVKLQNMERGNQSNDTDIATIKAELIKEKEEALLQLALQHDRERMDAEHRAISTMREQSEKAIKQLQDQAKVDLEKELAALQERHEEELTSRAAASHSSSASGRSRSESLTSSIETEIAQRQKEIEAKLTVQYEAELHQVKQGIELRLKSEEAAFKQKEEALNKELNATHDRLQQDKQSYESKLQSLESNQIDSQAYRDEIDKLKTQLSSKEQELRLNSALQQERDLFASQQKEISSAKNSAEAQYQLDLDKMQARLTEETTKLQQLQQALAASNNKNAETDDALSKIKSDMNLEIVRLQDEMKSNENKLRSEQDQHKKANDNMQNALEKLQQELEQERQKTSGLSKQFSESQNKVKQLEIVAPVAVAAAPVVGKSDREEFLEAELEFSKKENAKLQTEIASLKQQLAAAKAAPSASPESATPAMARPVNPMAAALRAAVPQAEATAGNSDSGAPITQRPPNPMAAAFKAGGGEALATRPKNPMLMGIQGGVQLKKTTPGQGPSGGAGGPAKGPGGPKPPGPLSLVDQLKGGVQLKRAEVKQNPVPIADNQSTASIAAQLARERQARQAAGTIKFPK